MSLDQYLRYGSNLSLNNGADSVLILYQIIRLMVQICLGTVVFQIKKETIIA